MSASPWEIEPEFLRAHQAGALSMMEVCNLEDFLLALPDEESLVPQHLIPAFQRLQLWQLEIEGPSQ